MWQTCVTYCSMLVGRRLERPETSSAENVLGGSSFVVVVVGGGRAHCIELLERGDERAEVVLERARGVRLRPSRARGGRCRRAPSSRAVSCRRGVGALERASRRLGPRRRSCRCSSRCTTSRRSTACRSRWSECPTTRPWSATRCDAVFDEEPHAEPRPIPTSAATISSLPSTHRRYSLTSRFPAGVGPSHPPERIASIVDADRGPASRRGAW